MNHVIIWMTVIWVLAAGAGGCGNSSPTGEPAGSATSITDRTNSARAAYEERMRKELDHLKDQLEELKTKAKTSSGQARQEMNRTFQDLDQKSRNARGKLQDLKSATEENWNQLKREVDRAVNDLHQSYKRASSHVNPEQTEAFVPSRLSRL